MLQVSVMKFRSDSYEYTAQVLDGFGVELQNQRKETYTICEFKQECTDSGYN